MQANKRSVLRGQQAHGATAAERTARHTANAALLEAFRVLRALFHQQPAVQSMQDKVCIRMSVSMRFCKGIASLRRAGCACIKRGCRTCWVHQHSRPAVNLQPAISLPLSPVKRKVLFTAHGHIAATTKYPLVRQQADPRWLSCRFYQPCGPS